jgi:hypothetical protein
MPEAPSFIDQYTRQLGINWRVIREVGSVDRPSILTDPDAQLHRIITPAHGVAQCDAVHELVHASWAEQLDPIFASVFFDPELDTSDAETTNKMTMVYYAQQLIDVWVSDRMGQLNMKLVEEDVSSFTQSLLRLQPVSFQNAPLEVALGTAMNRAQIGRFSLKGYNNKQKQIEERVEKILGRDYRRMTKKLGELYSGLPLLSQQRAEALDQFQQHTQKAARIIGFPINPFIVDVGNRAYWRM